MKDYSAMSDFEINRAVAMKIEGVAGNEDGCPKFAIDCFLRGDSESVHVLWTGHDEFSNFNPCNNPADAWPIIVSNHIGIMPFKNGEAKVWPLSVGLLSSADVKHANPLRAAMIVYLQMKDNK